MRPVLAAVEPTLHQDVLHLPAGGQVGQTRLDPLPHLPDDGLGRLLLPGPLSSQQLVPNCPEGVHVTGPETPTFYTDVVIMTIKDSLSVKKNIVAERRD